MVDMVVHRHKLRATIARLCRLLGAEGGPAGPPEPQVDRGRARLGRCSMERSDAILERLLHLHPREIDLSLERIERADGRPRPSRAAPAAGDPRRRHQRQGLDHRLHARDARSRRPARARLHLAASRPLPRAHPPRRSRRRPLRRRGRAGRRAPRGRDGQCRPADHAVRDHHRRRLRPLRPPPGRRAPARGRARRPARRHQRHRRAAGDGDHLGLDRPREIPRRHARRRSPPRRPASSSAAGRRSSRRSPRRR